MSSILRALRALPIYVVTTKTRYNEFHPDAAVPTQDTGTRNDSLNAGGAIGVTQITDVTGLVAWKDYIPVQNEAGRTVPYSYNANGYFPIKKASGSIFTQPDTWNPASKGSTVTLTNGNKTAAMAGNQGDWAVSVGTRTAGKLYFEILVDLASTFSPVGIVPSTQSVENAGLGGTEACRYLAGNWVLAGSNGVGCVAGDVLGFAVDIPNKTITAYRNGGAADSSRTWATYSSIKIGMCNNGGTGPRYTMRTATSEFSYSPPSGYTPWADGS